MNPTWKLLLLTAIETQRVLQNQKTPPSSKELTKALLPLHPFLLKLPNLLFKFASQRHIRPLRIRSFFQIFSLNIRQLRIGKAMRVIPLREAHSLTIGANLMLIISVHRWKNYLAREKRKCKTGRYTPSQSRRLWKHAHRRCFSRRKIPRI